MDLKTRIRANKLAVKNAKKFCRKASLQKADLHDQYFHCQRNKYPFYGHLEVHNNDCSPFLMYLNHDDLVAQTYFWYGNNSYERCSISEWIKRSKQVATIMDVGAYTGVYALAANGANPHADIHAFEPTRRVYGRLLSNIQLNQLSHRITLVNRAVSNAAGEVNFLQYRGEHILGAGASFVDKKIDIIEGDEIVKTITLDEYASEHELNIDLVKIDVEEAELMVVEGMQGVLDRDKPEILIEVTPQTVAGVVDLLKKHAYRFFSIDDAQMSVGLMQDPVNYLHQLLMDSPRDRISCNILALRR